MGKCKELQQDREERLVIKLDLLCICGEVSRLCPGLGTFRIRSNSVLGTLTIFISRWKEQSGSEAIISKEIAVSHMRQAKRGLDRVLVLSVLRYD